MRVIFQIVFLLLFVQLVWGKILEVGEGEMPELSNESSAFRGKILSEEYLGHTWVTYPHVENPASLDIDPMGRVFVAEAHRFNLGVPDLRSNRHMIQDDFKSITTDDRLKMYQKFQDKRPMDWYAQYPERLILLEDRDGNYVADHRSLFSDAFDEPLDGIGFSLLAEREAVYFTCIPAVRKLTDADGDGIAEGNEKIVEGFGVRVSFTGHDLHGIIRGPDGRLYFTVGDRGYHVMDGQGEIQAAAGKGAVFRCDSDGSNFEVYAMGLRNPQELSFDDHGNLFTFDNTGDIGDDFGRVVYVLDNTDSGWDMSHQSAHQYVRDLDWGDFHVSKSVWVGEKMYDTFSPSAPQWVFPPIGHAGSGPSGVTRLTGTSVPESMRNAFLLTDYRGAATKCQSLVIKLRPDGSSFKVFNVDPLVEGLAASDVELGYDGNLYFADYGGGWSANRNGTIQVLRPVDDKARRDGAETARMFEMGFSHRSIAELESLLDSADQRVRQEAQFALVGKGIESLPTLIELIEQEKEFALSSLHGVWALGQLFRAGFEEASDPILSALQSEQVEIRANAARVAGDVGIVEARDLLISSLEDESNRVVSLAAIALGRICKPGDREAERALFEAVGRNQGSGFEVGLRHSFLSALSRISTADSLSEVASSDSYERRLMAVLILRRLEHEDLALYLEDAHDLVRYEAIRAVYDTSALTSPAGSKLLAVDLDDLPVYLQIRILSAGFRSQGTDGARLLIRAAADLDLDDETRLFALRALGRWSDPPQFDAVLGDYRPMEASDLELTSISDGLRSSYLEFLTKEKNAKLASLGTDVAKILGIELDPDLLRQQAVEAELASSVRISCLMTLANLGLQEDDEFFQSLLEDETDAIRAFALKVCFERELDGMEAFALRAVNDETPAVAREAIRQLGETLPEKLIEFWENRELELRSELWLDLYTVMTSIDHAEAKQVAATYAAGDPGRVHALSLNGGDPSAGELVFRNQGACLQCHKIDGQGGVQGPELSLVGDRLDAEKLLESLVNPSAEITPGYGLSNVVLNSGTALVGRLASEKEDEVTVITPDGATHEVDRNEIAAISPPISAMPPLGLTLPPMELRDLISYLSDRNQKSLKLAKKKLKHGKEEGEKLDEEESEE
ncbi:MAG: HEAT repeat domain-containing protein [Verrucomicrobiota bacterium]|nr:HEAT repeat domain-containing protein [Verrucomicrobiota bacterium]